MEYEVRPRCFSGFSAVVKETRSNRIVVRTHQASEWKPSESGSDCATQREWVHSYCIAETKATDAK